MNTVRAIRQRLGVKQAELATALGVSQGNVSFIERGVQEIQPDAARLLVAFAREKDLAITLDQVYGLEPLPFEVEAEPKAA